jgi:hypothetical protein
MNFEQGQAVVFKNKTVLLRAHVKSRLYKVDYAVNKALVSDSESYAQKTLQKEAAYKKIL